MANPDQSQQSVFVKAGAFQKKLQILSLVNLTLFRDCWYVFFITLTKNESSVVSTGYNLFIHVLILDNDQLVIGLEVGFSENSVFNKTYTLRFSPKQIISFSENKI